ncbi:MAG: SMP-30/gluconolactonase/LRE family protein [Candidatus Hydrogenedentota bacterium]
MNMRLATIGFVCLCASVVSAAEYKTEVFIPGNGFHGIHGISCDADGNIYVGSVVGQAIYKVDPATGASSVWEGPANGMADDIEIAADGRLYWTSFILGKVHTRLGDGPVTELATGLPGINSLALKQDGRLFATQVFLADALYEIDREGKKPARKILADMGGLNGFDFGPDGLLYGPLWFEGQVVSLDVDRIELRVIADGFKIPAAVNFNSKGELFVVDSARGEVVKVDVRTGKKKVISRVRTGIDNLAFDADDNLYLTIMNESAIYQVDVDTGKTRMVKEAKLGAPQDIAIQGDTLYLSDTFAIRAIDLKSGKVMSMARVPEHELEYSNGISVRGGDVHQASYFNSAVQTLDRRTGEILKTYHDLVTPFDTLETDDGRLLALQMMNGTIVELIDEEKRATVVEGLSLPVAMVRAGANSIYVTEYMKGDVVRVDLASGAKDIVASGLNQPEGIAVGRDGTLYVAEVGARRVVSIDPVSGKKTVISEDLPIGFKAAPGMPPMGGTTGVAVSGSGDVYVTSDLEDAIYKISKK